MADGNSTPKSVSSLSDELAWVLEVYAEQQLGLYVPHMTVTSVTALELLSSTVDVISIHSAKHMTNTPSTKEYFASGYIHYGHPCNNHSSRIIKNQRTVEAEDGSGWWHSKANC